jgi:tetratricopeptide (TPR) repeat protein/predicted Ser/Thr protein kinase
MTSERRQRVKDLCNRAMEREPPDRGAFLVENCLDDHELREEVEALLMEATEGNGIIDVPVWQQLGIGTVPTVMRANAPASRGLPEAIGRYRVLRLLGEGGMGAVYEVEQDHPRRVVALKVIKPGLTSPELLRRFERESRALGRLQHPGIAQIYEAGSADTGFGPQPYFAMEFIAGETLTDYADSHRLGTRDRLELLARACDAVEHAHQRGIIHRDLKPGNIMLDESGQPKILDFGVARVTDSDGHVTRQTDLGQLIGTLAYMSPEQVLADPLELDTRSDVYALGVILYELLAARLPYRLSGTLIEAARIIREEDPARLSSISRVYRGDVETIVAKALEKDKARRYASAAALAADIRRHLADEPIAARPASATYQLQKFARRHKALVTATAVVFAVLVGGIAASTREAVKARRAEQRAQAVNDFLQNDLLAQASVSTQAAPGTKPDPDLKVRTALDRAAARIGGKFGQQPDVEAAIRDTIGQTYLDLGVFAEARAQLARALDLRRQTLGPENPATLKTISRLGRTAYLQGLYPEAEGLFRQALAVQRRDLGPQHPDTLFSMNGLAVVCLVEGKYAEAEALHRQTLEGRRRLLGPEHPDTVTSLHNLAIVYDGQGKYEHAEALHSQALEIRRRILGSEHPNTVGSLANLAGVYLERGQFAQAEASYNEVLEIRRRTLGPEHPDTLATMNSLGMIATGQGKYAQAGALFSQGLEIWRRTFGPDNPDTPVWMDNLASTYGLRGQYAQGEALFKQTVDISRRALGAQHPTTLAFVADFASMYQRQGKYSLAESYGAQALAERRHALGLEHPETMASVADLALTYVSQQKFVESEPLAREVLEFERKTLPDDWHRFRAESLLGASLAGQKKYPEAEPLLLEGYREMAKRKAKIDVPNTYHLDLAREWVTRLYQVWGSPDRAAEWRQTLAKAQ